MRFRDCPALNPPMGAQPGGGRLSATGIDVDGNMVVVVEAPPAA